MLNLKRILLLASFTIFTIKAQAQLAASFTASPTSGCASINFTVNFTNNSIGATSYSWNFGNGSPSSSQTNPSTTYSTAGTYDVVLTAMNGSSSTTDTVVITVYGSGTPTSVSIAANSGNTVCSGTAVTFTAIPFLGGSSPSYQLKKNGTNVGTNSNTYTNSSLSNGDVITCFLTSNASCASPDAATSNAITMTVSANTTPTLSITGKDTICSGIADTFTATSNVAGVTYQWLLNGAVAGTNSNVYTATPANGNVIKCAATMPLTGCYTAGTDTSNAINMLVNPTIVPTISVTSSANNVCAGTPVDYTATTNIIGGTFHWMVNISNVGADTGYYSYTPLNGDAVFCSIKVPSSGCYNPDSLNSTGVIMNVMPYITPVIVLSGPANAAPGSVVTITATITGAGSSYSILWKKNGLIFNTTSVPYTAYTMNGSNDVITATITVLSPGCYNTATSAPWEVTVNTSGVATIRGQQDITAYPNPFSQQLSLTGLLQGDKIAIYDVLGRKRTEISEVNNNDPQQQIPLTLLSPGIYFLHVWNSDGESVANISIQKQ